MCKLVTSKEEEFNSFNNGNQRINYKFLGKSNEFLI